MARKLEGKKPVGGISRRTWMNKIKTDVGEIVRNGMDWICLAQDRDKWKVRENAEKNFQFPE
jgi:hypothetical protein